MTPSFSGRIAWIVPGVRPSMRLASMPTAWTSAVRASIATTDGSDSTIPRPRTYTSVFAVPRSTAMSRPPKPVSEEKRPMSAPESSYGFPTFLTKPGLFRDRSRSTFEDMNSVHLIGNLATGVELRLVGPGEEAEREEKKVASFLLAVDRGSRDGGADFVWITVWDRQAELCAQYLDKGNR